MAGKKTATPTRHNLTQAHFAWAQRIVVSCGEHQPSRKETLPEGESVERKKISTTLDPLVQLHTVALTTPRSPHGKGTESLK